MSRALVDIRILQREFLLAISRALTAELDLHDLLRLILKSSVELVSGKAGLIALVDESGETLQVAAVYGIPPHLVDLFAPLVREVPYHEEHEGESFFELKTRLHRIMSEADLGLTQVIRLPLNIGGQVTGLIYVFQSGNYYFVEDAPNLLRSFAEQAAIAVRNARLYQAVVDRQPERAQRAALEHIGSVLENFREIEQEEQRLVRATMRLEGWT